MKEAKIHKLSKLSKDEIQKAFEFQREQGIWDFYAEREFLENVLNQRVNFVIAVFALVITGAFQVNAMSKSCILFGIGAIFLFILYLSAKRIYARLDIVLKILYKIDENHVFPMVLQEINSLSPWERLGQQTKNTYVRIPFFCMIVLALGFILSLMLITLPKGLEILTYLKSFP